LIVQGCITSTLCRKERAMVATFASTRDDRVMIKRDERTARPPVTRQVDCRQLPLVDAFSRYRAAIEAPFSAPGLKRGAGACAELRLLLGEDALAADVWMGIESHDPAQRAAENLAAAAWGADRTFFLINGSSSGTHAFLLATLAPGDEVVLARDVHQSVLTGLLLTGARPIWIVPRLHSEWDVGLGIAPADVSAALAAHPSAKLVVLTSPTSHGVISDVAAITDLAHARGVPVFVDEAWGAHLPFHPALPPSALASGADGAVTSPHKLLAALRQGALLHLREGLIDIERIATTVHLTQTTSPSLPILAGLDACRRHMTRHGEGLLERTIGLGFSARRRLAALPGITVLGSAQLGDVSCDPTRVVLDLRRLGMTGVTAEHVLRERFGVAPVIGERAGIVCAITIGDTRQSVDRLVDALAALAVERSSHGALQVSAASWGYRFLLTPRAQELTPREAFFAPSRAVPHDNAVGQTAADPVIPYPPGIPAVIPGEILTAETVAFLREGVANGMQLRGASDPSLATIRVVAEKAAQ